MHFFYLDASALAKRYTPEIGSPVVNHLFASVPRNRLYVLSVGTAELASILVRKQNSGHLSPAALAQAFADVGTEIFPPNGPRKIPANTALAFAALPLIRAHSINGTDGLLLRSALHFATHHRANGHDLVLVASDRRLLRAAGAEGLATFNPETQDQAALAAFLRP